MDSRILEGQHPLPTNAVAALEHPAVIGADDGHVLALEPEEDGLGREVAGADATGSGLEKDKHADGVVIVVYLQKYTVVYYTLCYALTLLLQLVDTGMAVLDGSPPIGRFPHTSSRSRGPPESSLSVSTSTGMGMSCEAAGGGTKVRISRTAAAAAASANLERSPSIAFTFRYIYATGCMTVAFILLG